MLNKKYTTVRTRSVLDLAFDFTCCTSLIKPNMHLKNEDDCKNLYVQSYAQMLFGQVLSHHFHENGQRIMQFLLMFYLICFTCTIVYSSHQSEAPVSSNPEIDLLCIGSVTTAQQNTDSMSTAIKFVTFNCQGLQGTRKRRKVFHWLHKKRANIYLLQETHSVSENEKDWINQWGDHIIFSHADTESKGTAIFFNGDFDYHIRDSYSDRLGRFIIIDIEINAVRTLIVNTYAPSGDDEQFFIEIINKINQYDCNNILWGGDFNLVFNLALDKKGGLPVTHFKCREVIWDWMAEHDMIDVWRCQHGNDKEYTWFSHRRPKGKRSIDPNVQKEYEYIACRLDFFIVPFNMQQNVTYNKILAGFHSDHALVALSLNMNKISRGRGFWKINTSLLENSDYLEEIGRTIDNTPLENPNTPAGLLWEQTKCNIRRDSISFSHRLRKKHKDDLIKLEADKTRLQERLLQSPCAALGEELKHIESEIDSKIAYQVQGAAIRARSLFYEQGEKSTKFFHGLEKVKGNSKIISTLINSNGDKIEGIKEVLEEEKNFYAEIYKSKINQADIDQNLWNQFFPDAQPERFEDLEEPLTETEIWVALQESENNKSPGTDGLSVDFYKVFWKKIKHLLLRSYNEAFNEGTLSITQRQGLLSLLPKKGKDPLNLNNWRPISILNHDQKVLTKALANRVKPCLDKCITSEQTGFVSERYIGENVLNLISISDHLLNSKQTGRALLLDFEKAFDSVEWHIIDAALKYHGFGPKFRKWVKCIQNNPVSCVVNAGHISSFFQISRGVRQGCPLSPYLFILTIEVLANKIRNSAQIKGIKIGEVQTKINLYADDVTLFLEDTPDNVASAIHIIEKFGLISGLKLNHAKTETMVLGKGNAEKSEGLINLLGVKMSNNVSEMVEANTDPILSKMSNTIQTWKGRNLSLLGRIYILKSLCVSLVHHSWSVLPFPSENILKEMNSMFFDFIWKGKTEKLKRSILTGPYDLGGAEMVNIRCLAKTLHLKWVIRYLDKTMAPWKLYLENNTVISDVRYCLKCNLSPKDSGYMLKNTTCQVWNDIIFAWCEYNYPNIVNNWSRVLKQTLWLNSQIRQQQKPMINVNWFQKGIHYIKDIVVEKENRFLSLAEFQTKFNLNCNFLQYMGLLQSIPVEWRRFVTRGPDMFDMEKKSDYKKHTIDCFKTYDHKKIYRELASSACDIAEVNFYKWNSDFNLKERVMDEVEWAEGYSKCFGWTKSVELRSFEYRFRSRLLFSNSRLFKMGITQSPHCERCPEMVETLRHTFWDCPSVHDFWLKLFLWLNTIFDLCLEAEPRLCLFYLLDDTGLVVPDIYMLILLLAKQYVWNSRCTGRPVVIYGGLQAIKTVEKLELATAIRNDRWPKHHHKWGPLTSKVRESMVNKGTAKEQWVEVDTSHMYRVKNV